MSDPGAQLRKNNDQIVHYLTTLKTQRNEINQLIQKQEDEMKKLQQEVERITYKIALITKSLAQRMAARDKYDITIQEAEENYKRIVECSGILLNSMSKEYGALAEAMDKKVGPDGDDEKELEPVKNEKSVKEKLKVEKDIDNESNSSRENNDKKRSTKESDHSRHKESKNIESDNKKRNSDISSNLENKKPSQSKNKENSESIKILPTNLEKHKFEKVIEEHMKVVPSKSESVDSELLDVAPDINFFSDQDETIDLEKLDFEDSDSTALNRIKTMSTVIANNLSTGSNEMFRDEK